MPASSIAKKKVEINAQIIKGQRSIQLCVQVDLFLSWYKPEKKFGKN